MSEALVLPQETPNGSIAPHPHLVSLSLSSQAVGVI